MLSNPGIDPIQPRYPRLGPPGLDPVGPRPARPPAMDPSPPPYYLGPPVQAAPPRPDAGPLLQGMRTGMNSYWMALPSAPGPRTAPTLPSSGPYGPRPLHPSTIAAMHAALGAYPYKRPRVYQSGFPSGGWW